MNQRDQVLLAHPDTSRNFFDVLLDDNSGRYEARPLAQDEVVPVQTVELDFRVVPEDLLEALRLARPFIDLEFLIQSFLQADGMPVLDIS